MIDLGQTIRARRSEMDLSLEALARELGNSPGQTFLSRIERGVVSVNPRLAARLAKVLRLPEDDVLLAAGFAPETEIERALQRLKQHLSSPVPKQVVLPVLDITGKTIDHRRRMMSVPEDAFLIDLQGVRSEPFIGEALVLRRRIPVDGIGVVAEYEGELGAYTYRDQGGKVWIEDARKQRYGGGYTILGVIGRVATERTFID